MSNDGPKRIGTEPTEHTNLIKQLMSGWRDPRDVVVDANADKARAPEFTTTDFHNIAIGIFAKVPSKDIPAQPPKDKVPGFYTQLVEAYQELKSDDDKKIFLHNAQLFINEMINADRNLEFAQDNFRGIDQFTRLGMNANFNAGESEEVKATFKNMEQQLKESLKTVEAARKEIQSKGKPLLPTKPKDDPRAIAEDLKQYHVSLLNDLTLSSLHNGSFLKSDKSAMQGLIDSTNGLSNKIAIDILSAKNKSKREKTYEKYVRIMDESIKIGDFHTASSIYNAFKQGPIDRLELADSLSKTDRAKLAYGEKVCEPLGNYREARKLMDEFKQRGEMSIPLVALCARDLNGVEENPNQLRGKVNEDKIRLAGKVTDALIDAKKQAVSQKVSNYQTRFTEEIRNMPKFTNADAIVNVLQEASMNIKKPNRAPQAGPKYIKAGSSPASKDILRFIQQEHAAKEAEKAAEAKAAEAKAAEAKAAEAKPVEVQPAEKEPVVTAQATPTQVTPTQATPTQATATQAPPIQATPTQATPTQATPTQMQPPVWQPVAETKPSLAKGKELDAFFKQLGFINEIKEGASVLHELNEKSSFIFQKQTVKWEDDYQPNYNELSNPKTREGVRKVEELISTEGSYLEGLQAFTPAKIEKMLTAFDGLTPEEKNGWQKGDLEYLLKSQLVLAAVSKDMLSAFKEGRYEDAAVLMEKSAQLYGKYAAIFKPLPPKLNGAEFFEPLYGKSANDYLITPVQRFPRYVMLSNELLAKVPHDAEAYQACQIMALQAAAAADKINKIKGYSETKNVLAKLAEKNFKERTPESKMLEDISREFNKRSNASTEGKLSDIIATLYEDVKIKSPKPTADEEARLKSFNKSMDKLLPLIKEIDSTFNLETIKKQVDNKLKQAMPVQSTQPAVTPTPRAQSLPIEPTQPAVTQPPRPQSVPVQPTIVTTEPKPSEPQAQTPTPQAQVQTSTAAPMQPEPEAQSEPKASTVARRAQLKRTDAIRDLQAKTTHKALPEIPKPAKPLPPLPPRKQPQPSTPQQSAQQVRNDTARNGLQNLKANRVLPPLPKTPQSQASSTATVTPTSQTQESTATVAQPTPEIKPLQPKAQAQPEQRPQRPQLPPRLPPEVRAAMTERAKRFGALRGAERVRIQQELVQEQSKAPTATVSSPTQTVTDQQPKPPLSSTQSPSASRRPAWMVDREVQPAKPQQPDLLSSLSSFVTSPGLASTVDTNPPEMGRRQRTRADATASIRADAKPTETQHHTAMTAAFQLQKLANRDFTLDTKEAENVQKVDTSPSKNPIKPGGMR